MNSPSTRFQNRVSRNERPGKGFLATKGTEALDPRNVRNPRRQLEQPLLYLFGREFDHSCNARFLAQNDTNNQSALIPNRSRSCFPDSRKGHCMG